MVVLRDDDDDTMYGVKMGGGGMREGINNKDSIISQELDRIHPSAALRLTSILAFPQMVLIPQKTHDTQFIDYYKLQIITNYEIK